jgi:O-antigen ligase
MLLPTVGLRDIQTHASSLWLQTLAEQGIVGFAALLWFAYAALRETFALRNSALGLAAFLALASLLAHQLVDDLFFFPKVAALGWHLLGAGTATQLSLRPSRLVNGKPHVPLISAQEADVSSRERSPDPVRFSD